MANTLGDMLPLSVIIALGFLAAVAFYESMSTRDVLVARALRVTRRITSRRWAIGIAYLLTVGVGIPLLVVLWTAVLELFLVAVGSVDQLGNIAVVAASIVGAARILSYARQSTAHELAKAVPLAFAFVLLTGGALKLDDNLERLVAEPDRSDLTPELIGFLIVLEIGLRIMNDGSHALMAQIRKRRGVSSDVGVWRTLWLGFRRPLVEALPEPPEAGAEASDLTEPQGTSATGP